ncbi:MAG: hypothetical protein P4M05_31735 [Bradyrhizobium sp.]|nr:hypothetical protein [Bradyrhizobium sp.]
MRSIWATRASPSDPTQIHPALNSFADECRGMLVHLAVYLGVLALLVIIGAHLWGELPDSAGVEPAAKAGWSLATRSHPAFAVSQFDLNGKTETYEIFRHPQGGRKDILRWAARGEKPVAELEIYRPGGESGASGPAIAEIAARMDAEDWHELEAAGVIESKFGPVTLLRLAGDASDAAPCLGFLKHLDEPGVRISGWLCQGDDLPARRAAIGCMLNRLILLTSGNESKLAELFARAELRRGSCAAAIPPTSADWVTGAQNPRLRGSL